jgi:hypothetical protein
MQHSVEIDINYFAWVLSKLRVHQCESHAHALYLSTNSSPLHLQHHILGSPCLEALCSDFKHRHPEWDLLLLSGGKSALNALAQQPERDSVVNLDTLDE